MATATAAQEQWKENLNMHMMCRECKEYPPNLVEEFASGDMVCGSCGLVLGDRIVDTRSEWRTFSNDDQGSDDPSRVGDGANPLLNGSQLQTTIAFSDGANARSRDLHRAQNKSTHDKSTKTLLAAYKELGALCDSMHIQSNISNYAKQLFKQVHDAGVFRGKSQETIIAGCLFIACRQMGVPRTFREIFAVTKVSKAEIGRIFKVLEKFFAQQNVERQTKLENAGGSGPANDDYKNTQSTDPTTLCDRYCAQLDLKFAISKIAQEIATKTDKVGSLAGRSPLSIAAACIYMASHLMGQPKTPKDISAVAGVSDGTIRNAYKLVYPKREELIDPAWLGEGKGDVSLLPTA